MTNKSRLEKILTQENFEWLKEKAKKSKNEPDEYLNWLVDQEKEENPMSPDFDDLQDPELALIFVFNQLAEKNRDIFLQTVRDLDKFVSKNNSIIDVSDEFCNILKDLNEGDETSFNSFDKYLKGRADDFF